MTIEQLRDVYRHIRREAIIDMGESPDAETNRRFDALVFDRLNAFNLLDNDLGATPESWVRQARILGSQAAAERENHEEYLFDRARQMENDYMGYDTLQERDMDREES